MDFSSLQTLIKETGTFIPLTIIRSEQSASQPAKPFGTYKVTSKNNGDFRNRIQKTNLDPTKYSEEYLRKEYFIVSLSFIGQDISALFGYADKAFNYLNAASRDKKKELGVAIELQNSIQDRTAYIEPIYEYKVGFDFKVHGVGKLEQTIDAIDIQATMNSIEYNYE